MPGALEEHERVEGLEHERPHLVDVLRLGEVETCGCDGNDGGHVERHERLGVRVVTEHHRAHGSVVGVRHLVVAVPDHVDVRVGPLEMQLLQRVARVGVGHRQPSERRPRVVGQGRRNDGDESHGRIVVDLFDPTPVEELMDVRSIEDVEPIVEHNGTVPVWWLVSRAR